MLATKQIAKSTAKEKAHLQSAPPKPKTAKELFTSFLSPPPKKNKFPSATPTYLQLIEQKSTAYNIGFAKAGVKFPCGESFVIFSRKIPFRFFIFCNFEKTKMVFAQIRVYRKFRLS